MPLLNPRRGDYLLNRTHSTEGIASKISLELKKRYLLGSSGLNNPVKKSGSASILDSRFKSFVDQISEHQKLLNPAPEPSPTMQAFLHGADKLHISPSATHVVKKEKELPEVGNFSHICHLKNKENSVSVVELPTNKNNSSSTFVDELSTNDRKESKKEEEDGISRPRSPVHETSIVVPELPQNNNIEDDDIDSDSLSSGNNSSSEEESDAKSQGQVNIPPKVEIHNSRGELMEDESVPSESKPDVAETKPDVEPPTLDSLNMVVPDICQHSRPTDFLPNVLFSNRSKVDSVPTKDNKENNSFQKIITVPSSNEKDHNRGEILKQVSTTAELCISDMINDDSKESGKSNPSSPISEQGDDDDDGSLNNESLVANLTETELSDWARDEDVCASENLDDLEYNINPQYITFRRHQKPKNWVSKGVAANIARTEDFEDDYSHVCGKVDKVPQASNLLVNIENIEFMDTGGEEESSIDDFPKNSGYVQFVNTNTDEDDDLNTPMADEPVNCLPGTDLVEDSGDTTTSNSEAVTIMESPLDVKKDIEINMNPPVVDPTTTADLSNKTYEEYVKRLQGRISPFSNVRDSIDIRKSKKNTSNKVLNSSFPPEETLVEIVDKEEKLLISNNIAPTMSQKLEELSKERSKQKNLIHEMVLEKHKLQGKSPQERKAKRNSRSTPSPRLGSQNSIISLPSGKTDSPLEVDKSETKFCDSIKPKPSTTPTNKGYDGVISSVEDNHQIEEVFQMPGSNTSDNFFSPMTSFKEQATTNRPLSMNFSLRLHNSVTKEKILPVTPLTNPEAFSLPDIRKALFDSEVDDQSPINLPRLQTIDRDQVREMARARAKMLTDEELGLSPEERIKRLKEKVCRKFERSESSPASSRYEPHSLKESLPLSRSNDSLAVARVPDLTKTTDSELETPKIPEKTSTKDTPQNAEEKVILFFYLPYYCFYSCIQYFNYLTTNC